MKFELKITDENGEVKSHVLFKIEKGKWKKFIKELSVMEDCRSVGEIYRILKVELKKVLMDKMNLRKGLNEKPEDCYSQKWDWSKVSV